MIHYLIRQLKIENSKIEKFTIKDSLPPKWARKDIPLEQQEKTEHENTKAPINADLVSHKPFFTFANSKQIRRDIEVFISSWQCKIKINSRRQISQNLTFL